jgi:ATP-dependent RNA helicase RhlE
VFSRTKHGADKITRVLEKAGIKCAAIHGNKSQNRRQEALGNFKCEQIRVLVATDIAARGIDVDDVSHVFNYDLPDVPETFVHRIGRTARAGKDGIAISFCAPDEEQDLKAIEKLTRISIPEGDKAIFEKLPPPQKETPESEMRNARGRGFPRRGNPHENRHNDRRENRGGAKSEKQGNAPQQNSPKAQNKAQNEKLPVAKSEGVPQMNPQNQEGRRTIGKNRPGSRARKRMREAAAKAAAAKQNN